MAMMKAVAAPAAEGTAIALQAPLASASAADASMPHAALDQGHAWGVLGAIVLIVFAVAWSLLRQRSGSARRR